MAHLNGHTGHKESKKEKATYTCHQWRVIDLYWCDRSQLSRCSSDVPPESIGKKALENLKLSTWNKTNTESILIRHKLTLADDPVRHMFLKLLETWCSSLREKNKPPSGTIESKCLNKHQEEPVLMLSNEATVWLFDRTAAPSTSVSYVVVAADWRLISSWTIEAAGVVDIHCFWCAQEVHICLPLIFPIFFSFFLQK